MKNIETNKIETINATKLSLPVGHYSHAACANGMIFISGLLPIAKQGDKVEGFDNQVRQVFNNLESVLSECKSDKSQLVQVRVYISDIELWPRFNELYAKWMGGYMPARCVVPVSVLHYNSKLEIEAVALQNK